jgi:hypothetical protein
VFYSFYYKQDFWRAATVRSIGSIEGNRPASDNDWENITNGGDPEIKTWLNEQMKYRSCTVQCRQANQLEAWAQSLAKLDMAYQVLVYPLLDEAERKHARDPLRDPHEHGPASHKMRIKKGVRDAQDNPDRDLKEHPHRGQLILMKPKCNFLAESHKPVAR